MVIVYRRQQGVVDMALILLRKFGLVSRDKSFNNGPRDRTKFIYSTKAAFPFAENLLLYSSSSVQCTEYNIHRKPLTIRTQIQNFFYKIVFQGSKTFRSFVFHCLLVSYWRISSKKGYSLKFLDTCKQSTHTYSTGLKEIYL